MCVCVYVYYMYVGGWRKAEKATISRIRSHEHTRTASEFMCQGCAFECFRMAGLITYNWFDVDIWRVAKLDDRLR